MKIHLVIHCTSGLIRVFCILTGSEFPEVVLVNLGELRLCVNGSHEQVLMMANLWAISL